MSGVISEDEYEREIQTLRNLRRRSGSSPGPGALAVDPDLPPPSPSSSFASTSYTSNDDVTLATPDGLDDGSLFWVPAHLHPELAPGDFKAFLKAHTSADPAEGDAGDAGTAPGLGRSGSWLSRSGSGRRGGGGEGLGRKRSMLSRQYEPRAGDKIEEEVPPMPSGRHRNSIYGGRGGEKGLTLQDLQRLETVVDQVDETEDPGQMRSMLRRSLSMNVAPGFLQDDVPQDDEENTPVVVPRPGSIIRRTARTKIRKAHLQGDGGGRRFAATRRGRTAVPQESDDPSRRSSGDSEDHLHDSADRHERAESAESHEYEERFQDAPESPMHIENRRGSDDTTDEGVVFDAYRSSRTSSISDDSNDRSLTASPDVSPPLGARKLSLPPITPGYSGAWDEGEKTPTQESVLDPLARSGMRRSPSAGNGEVEESRMGMRKVSAMKLEVPLPFDTPRQPGRPISPTLVTPTAPLARPTSMQSADYDLPPGMAPPALRQAVPPGIALQHQKSQESLGSTIIDSRPPLLRADSSSPAIPSSPVLSSSSTTSTKEKEKEKEKEKKGGFFGKKDKKEKEKKKEKEGFLGSLFGGSKKKQEEIITVGNFAAAGPAAAAALLGSSKSARPAAGLPGSSPTSPGFPGGNSFARYPIHVERAVYRLSHIKLANARRPLYEQVLISNLMFWYLGVIGRNVQEEKKADKEDVNGKSKEAEAAKPPPAKGTPPKSSEGGQAGNGQQVRREMEPTISVPPPQTPTTSQVHQQREREREREQQRAQPQPTLKKGLTKPERRRDGRDAEAAVRTPSYGMQNAQVDSDLRAREAREGRESRDFSKMQHGPGQGGRGAAPGLGPGPGPGQNGMAGPPSHHYQQQQQQQAYGGPPPGGQAAHPPRSASSPGISPDPRMRPGPSAPSGHSRPASDYGQPAFGPASREIPNAPRGVPQSSFGPPPPPGAGGSGSSGLDPHRDPRQRTMSSPSPAQAMQPGPGPAPGSGSMRRVVTEGRPESFGSGSGPLSPGGSKRSTHSAHAGPQPGQIFQYPGGSGSLSPTSGQGPVGRSVSPQPPGQGYPSRSSSHPSPGQIFAPPPGAGPGPGPGQVFHHPGAGSASPSSGYGQPMQHQQQQQHASRPLPELWQGSPQRLPPALGQPYTSHPQPPQQYRPEFGQPSYPQGPQQSFDPRRPLPGPAPQYPPNGQYSQPQYARPPPQHAQGQAQGQGNNLYMQVPPSGSREDHRRSQAVPGQYGHHR